MLQRTEQSAGDGARRGLVYGVTAYLLWGAFPLYLRALDEIAPPEILAHRILWSLALIAATIAIAGRGAALATALRDRAVLLLLLGTSVLIAINWLVYIHAVATDRLLAGSLGYYLNPLVSVLLGVVILKERLSRAQAGALLLAGAGVVVLALGAGGDLWISLTLAVSFSAYGLLRKIAPVDPLTGLGIETALLAPLAGLYLIGSAGEGRGGFGRDSTIDLLLILSGAVTAVPLLLFSAAAKRLRYATVGILQFIAPTLQFAIAVALFGERLTVPHLICFAAIWTAVAIYVAEAVRISRTADAPAG